MRFDLVSLDLVLAIAESRSITAGAERSHLALAAASRRLTDLETRLGVRLFDRRARGVQPTAAGDVLVRHVRQVRMLLIWTLLNRLLHGRRRIWSLAVWIISDGL